MRIAIVHYHLRPGGVTRVIQNAVAALRASDCRVAVFAGSLPAAGSFLPGEVHVVPGLDYLACRGGGRQVPVSVASLESAARKALGGLPDVWHFHNHTLGKNNALTWLVYQMAARGRKLLLQIHDFPEDGRPRNYQRLLSEIGEGRPTLLASRIYPDCNHVHYAVINSRDLAFLGQAGFSGSRVHFLPNAIDPGTIRARESALPEKSGRLFIYPTRALRRKNLGEFLLWSAIAREGDRFATTLAPTSAADLWPYQKWCAAARRLHLPVTFGIGRNNRLSFPDLLSSATAIVTTSLAEGFGLAFLEPWLAARPLAGRDLPEITDDFKSHAINLDGLYRHLLVPGEWINLDAFRRKIRIGYSGWLSDYNRPEPEHGGELAFKAAFRGDRIDFGRLDETLQLSVIRRLKSSVAMRSEISPVSLLRAAPSSAVISNNRKIIRRLYGLAPYRSQLERLYAIVAESEAGRLFPVSGETLLDRFLDPDRFYLLRS